MGIHAKADVNHKRNYNETFLFEAAQNGIVELAECLLAGGAEIDHANVFGETPLFHAAVNGHSELCYMLLQSGAKVNYESSADKSTALFRAARYGYTRVCEVLLAARADIHKTDINLANCPVFSRLKWRLGIVRLDDTCWRECESA